MRLPHTQRWRRRYLWSSLRALQALINITPNQRTHLPLKLSCHACDALVSYSGPRFIYSLVWAIIEYIPHLFIKYMHINNSQLHTTCIKQRQPKTSMLLKYTRKSNWLNSFLTHNLSHVISKVNIQFCRPNIITENYRKLSVSDWRWTGRLFTNHTPSYLPKATSTKATGNSRSGIPENLPS